jgi:hypothetical protein
MIAFTSWGERPAAGLSEELRPHGEVLSQIGNEQSLYIVISVRWVLV